jgi:hypothetical protein
LELGVLGLELGVMSYFFIRLCILNLGDQLLIEAGQEHESIVRKNLTHHITYITFKSLENRFGGFFARKESSKPKTLNI